MRQTDEWMEQALRDAEMTVRREALRISEPMLSRASFPKVMGGVVECLSYDDYDIRDRAWEISSKLLL
jgi:hypothetical protein